MMKQQTPAPWPPKMPEGKAETETPNGCDYAEGEKITSSYDKLSRRKPGSPSL